MIRHHETYKKPGSKHHELTRQQLYDLLWSTPATQVAIELGISDVALAKHCKKLDIPRPPRGYWTKVQSGHNPPQLPLPPSLDEIAVEGLRREPAPVEEPGDEQMESLHPLAAHYLALMGKEREKGMILLRDSALPTIYITKSQADRTAKIIHMVITEMESRGMPFRKNRRKDSGYFWRGEEFLHLTIEESVVMRVPTGTIRIKIWGEGRFATRGRGKHWDEKEGQSLSKLVAQVVTGICDHFLEMEKRAEDDGIQREKSRVAEEAEREQKKKFQHFQTLRDLKLTREQNLFLAAKLFHEHQLAENYILLCEARWRAGRDGKLSSDEDSWLEWARAELRKKCPFALGYPDPLIDGAFDRESVPLGGPYPQQRTLPNYPRNDATNR